MQKHLDNKHLKPILKHRRLKKRFCIEKNEGCEPNKKDSFLKMYNGTLSSWLFLELLLKTILSKIIMIAEDYLPRNAIEPLTCRFS